MWVCCHLRIFHFFCILFTFRCFSITMTSHVHYDKSPEDGLSMFMVTAITPTRHITGPCDTERLFIVWNHHLCTDLADIHVHDVLVAENSGKPAFIQRIVFGDLTPLIYALEHIKQAWVNWINTTRLRPNDNNIVDVIYKFVFAKENSCILIQIRWRSASSREN